MQCSKCGAVLDADTVFCPECGAMAVDMTIHQPEMPRISEIEAPEEMREEIPVKLPSEWKIWAKRYRGFLATLGATVGVLLITAIVIVAIALQPGNYTEAIENYIEVAYEGNFDKLDLLAPEAYWDHMATGGPYGPGSWEVLKKENELWYAKRRSIMQINCGEDMQTTYKVIAEKPVEEKELDNVREGIGNLNSEQGFIEKGYIIDIELYHSGSEGSQTESMTGVYVLLIDNRWYLATVNPYGLGGAYSVQFYLTGYGWME